MAINLVSPSPADLINPPPYGTEGYWYARVLDIPQHRFHMQVWCCEAAFRARDSDGKYLTKEVGCGHEPQTFNEIVRGFGLDPGVVSAIGGSIDDRKLKDDTYDQQMLTKRSHP